MDNLRSRWMVTVIYFSFLRNKFCSLFYSNFNLITWSTLVHKERFLFEILPDLMPSLHKTCCITWLFQKTENNYMRYNYKIKDKSIKTIKLTVGDFERLISFSHWYWPLCQLNSLAWRIKYNPIMLYNLAFYCNFFKSSHSLVH